MAEDPWKNDIKGMQLTAYDDDTHENDTLSSILHREDPTGAPFADIRAKANMPERVQLIANLATMECERGPCVHLWDVTQQASASVKYDTTRLQRFSACMLHGELQSLYDDRVFDCNHWWPAFLSFVPRSLRVLLRRQLKNYYEKLLRKHCDFSWKWWPRDFWQLDAEQQIEYRNRAQKILDEQQAKDQMEIHRD